MRVSHWSSMTLTLLAAAAWADQAPAPTKVQAAPKASTTISAEEKTKAATAPVKTPIKSSSSKSPTPAASAEVVRLIRSGQVDAGRTVADDYKKSEAPAVERADVALTYGNELVRYNRAAKGKDPALYGEAKQQFQSVIKDGAPTQQLVARNNQAALDLERGDSAAALKVLDEGYATAKEITEPSVRSHYFYNYAQALERASGPKNRNATDLYREAFIADPRRREAAAAGMKSALAQGNVAKAAEFADLMVERGHLGLAEERLRLALYDLKVRQSSDASLLIISLMGLIGAQKLSPPDFEKRWDSYVRGLGEGLDSRAKRMRTVLQLGYGPPDRLASLVQTPHPGNAPYYVKEQLGLNDFPNAQLARVSTYFWQVGRVRAAGGESGSALSLYSLAWLVNAENVNAATAKANLLLERQQEIDPDGKQLDRFVEELFMGKGGAYLGNDWRGILRFHTVLGTIYWKQKVWGTSGNPRGAIFQLEHAVSARKKIEGKEGAEPIPGLYSMLADCYVATKRLPQAYDAYQSAAREALTAANTDLAADIVNQKLPRIAGYEPTPKQREIEAALEKDILSQREGA